MHKFDKAHDTRFTNCSSPHKLTTELYADNAEYNLSTEHYERSTNLPPVVMTT